MESLKTDDPTFLKSFIRKLCPAHIKVKEFDPVHQARCPDDQLGLVRNC